MSSATITVESGMEKSASPQKRATPHYGKINKICVVCGEDFQVNHSARNSTKCSQKCHFQSMRRRVAKGCVICGKEFTSPSRLNRRACSRQCGAYLTKGVGNYRWILDREKTCPNCGKNYEAASGWRKDKMFCSRKCLSEHYQKNGGPRSKPIGSRYKDEDGYWIIKVGVRAWRPEHIVIGERMIGRELAWNEIVHHRNGDKGNNREDNLIVVTKSRHGQIHQAAERVGLSLLAQRVALPIMAGEWIHPIEGCEV